jgi:hypothetical protein
LNEKVSLSINVAKSEALQLLNCKSRGCDWRHSSLAERQDASFNAFNALIGSSNAQLVYKAAPVPLLLVTFGNISSRELQSKSLEIA